MKLSFKAMNPFYKPSQYIGRDYFFKNFNLSKNKSLEIQVSKFSPYDLIHLDVDLHWWGVDHAGPLFHIELYGFSFHVKLYDHRHWDYDTNDWEMNDN